MPLMSIQFFRHDETILPGIQSQAATTADDARIRRRISAVR